MMIRSANVADAEQVAAVLRRSIQELCVLDHGGDELALGQWLRNKTPEIVRSWIENTSQRIIVAEKDQLLIGVGGASDAGEITLNYVAPEARFKGVSKAMLHFLEDYLRHLGWGESRLTSTRTAHGFYIAAGYQDAGEPELWGKLLGQPMKKSL